MFRPRFHLEKKINRVVREIEEAGLRYKFELISSMFVSKQILKENENVVILDLDSLRGVLLLWVFGCVISVVVFVGELLIKRKYYMQQH